MLATYTDKALRQEREETLKTRRLLREQHARCMQRLSEAEHEGNTLVQADTVIGRHLEEIDAALAERAQSQEARG